MWYKDRSVVKNIGYPSREPKCDFQHQQGSSHLHIFLVTGDFTHSLWDSLETRNVYATQTHMQEKIVLPVK